MNNKLTDLVRIGIFYDGYYFYKVSNYYKYEHERKSRISISGLHDFIRNEAAKISGTDIKQCQIVDAHYFKGRSSARDLGDKVQSERIFEDILMRENIVTHYLPLRNGPNNILHEKGIDVWLALEAYEMSIYKHFDILVLVACDGDYVPLVRKLNTLGTHVMLISWDFDYYNENGQIGSTRTSQQLLEEVFHPLPMHQIIDGHTQDEFVKNLFVFDRDNNYTNYSHDTNTAPAAPDTPAPAVIKDDIYTHTIEDSDSVDNGCSEYEEIDSIILSVKEGYGFIEDRAVNNVFFHYNTVENADFNELKPGMKVRYLRVEDEEKSKIDGAPRYRAVKVFIVD
ncbi:hypothetical protein FACS189473_3460 [Spirochaetia bacterium]|nr:hypothetical protein FACS189473_3460 [Spirochaetia bacterium]